MVFFSSLFLLLDFIKIFYLFIYLFVKVKYNKRCINNMEHEEEAVWDSGRTVPNCEASIKIYIMLVVLLLATHTIILQQQYTHNNMLRNPFGFMLKSSMWKIFYFILSMELFLLLLYLFFVMFIPYLTSYSLCFLC